MTLKNYSLILLLLSLDLKNESLQSSNHLLLIRPAHFAYNSETSSSNVFQNELKITPQQVSEKAINEFDNLVLLLKKSSLNLLIIEDTPGPMKPDAVFPNNWITMHHDGRVILYPMMAPNRRKERRFEIIDFLRNRFSVSEIIDLSVYENQHRFLEGTGSIVFDHLNKMAYACASERTNKIVFNELCHILGYTPIYFHAYDNSNLLIYHTNVMMNIGEKYSVICLDSITNENERKKVTDSLENSGKEIIDISFDQINQFAGNMLEIKDADSSPILVMSKRAKDCLIDRQKDKLSEFVQLLSADISTIESIGGGSVRCMIAENFLPNKY